MKTIFKTFTAVAIVACSMLATSTAFSQTTSQAPFIGLGIGLSGSLVRNTLELSSKSADFSGTSTVGTVFGFYGFAMSKDWVGTVELSSGLKNSVYGSDDAGGVTSTAVAQNHVALSFAPGWRIGGQGLLYGKVALHSMDVTYSGSNGFDKTLTHQGIGFGMGYGLAVSPNVELRAEYQAIQFDVRDTSRINTAKPKQTDLSLGMLYRF